MAEHESSVGSSDEWYTPPEIFDALTFTEKGLTRLGVNALMAAVIKAGGSGVCR